MSLSKLVRAALFAACAGACAAPDRTDARQRVDGPLEVEASGIVLGASVRGDLARRVHALALRGRHGAATRLVAASSEAARAELAQVEGRASAEQRSLALAFERVSGAPWARAFAERAAHADRCETFDGERATLLARLRRGEIDAALDDLPLALPREGAARDLAAVESGRLEGLARMVAGDLGGAQACFERARAAASASAPFDVARIDLLAAACAARRGDAPRARESWSAAVSAEARRIEPRASFVLDGAFWERARGLAPADAVWPGDASSALVAWASSRLGVEVGELGTALALAIARARFESGDAQGAWLALRHEDVANGSDLVRARIAVEEARALVVMGQPATARARLAPLAIDAERAISAPALAILGAIELELARDDLAAELLDRALAEPAIEWPGRADALANQALARFARGDDAAGLEALRAAQARFASERDDGGLARALTNELLHLEREGADAATRALRVRIDEIEARTRY